MKNFLDLIKTNWWILVVIAFSLVKLIFEATFDKTNMIDLEVYYYTAKRLISSSELYGIALDQEGHYIYKYSPSAVFFFIPLTILPLQIAKISYWISLTFFMIISLSGLQKQAQIESSDKNKLFKNATFFALLSVLIHFDSELSLGQVNLVLLTLYVFIIYTYHKNMKVLPALLLAISIFLKPFGLIFLPYFLLKKKYKVLLYFTIFTVVIFLLPLLFYPSFESFIGLYKSWINELSIELGNKQDLFAKANHTVFSVFARYTPLKFILKGEIAQKFYQIIVLILIGILFFKLERTKPSVLAEMAVLIILIPLIAFTSKNAFIFAMPLAFYLLSYIKFQTKLVKTLIIAGCCLIGGNLYEVYGPKISMLYTETSMYAIGSIFLLIAMFLSRKYDARSYT